MVQEEKSPPTGTPFLPHKKRGGRESQTGEKSVIMMFCTRATQFSTGVAQNLHPAYTMHDSPPVDRQTINIF